MKRVNEANEQPADAVNDLPSTSIRRPVLVLVLNLLILLAGVAALMAVEIRELPDVDRPIVSVRAEYPGASPQTMDAEVISVIEGAVARVSGIRNIDSASEENAGRMRIEFRPGVDLDSAASDVREAVNRVLRELPDRVERVVVVKADDDSDAIVNLAAISDTLTEEEITRIVEKDIVPELISIEGVADVQLHGDRQRLLRVVVDPLRLTSYGLSVTDVAEVLRRAPFDVPAGSFRSEDQELIVRANASTVTAEAVADTILRDTIRIGDVASVYFGPEDARAYTRLNGRSVIGLGVVRQARSNTIDISDGVHAAMRRLNDRFQDLELVVTDDRAFFIRSAVSEVLLTLCFTIAIVMATIWLFMGSLRATLVPSIAIPVALVGTVAAIWLLGFSVNILTLLALVLATGLVVDDAIVVLENIQRLKSEGVGARAAAVVGTRQVFFAVIATTATLISVFLPISFLPSTAGRLFGEFGFVLAVTVCISSFVALTLVPVLASRLPDAKRDDAASPAAGRGSLAGLLGGAYAKVLDLVLAAPLVVVGLCAIVIAGAAITYISLGEELVPEEDRGMITVRLTGPDGVGLDYTDRQVEQVEAVLQPLIDDGTATSLFTITGRFDLNRGQIDAPLRDWSQRDVTSSEGVIAKSVNARLRSMPGARARVRRGNSLGLHNADGGIRFALTGSNYEEIADAADAFVVAMEENLPQIQNFRVEFRATQPQLSVSIDRRRAADLGVAIESLAATVQVLVDNDEVAELTINDERVPVILQAKAGAIDDPSDLHNLYVAAANDRLVPLSQLVTFKESAVAAELDRHGQRRAVEIFGDPVSGYSLREAVNAVQQLADAKLPPGIGLLFLDEAAALNETSSGVAITYLVALLIVFLVLVAQFESMSSALVVLLTVPFGICAAIFALALTGTTINIYSQIGVLMLIGIMAKNAILMVEFADQLRESGSTAMDAVRRASIVRLRPIAMTMVSTVLAGLPLILGGGPGLEARAAIGWVVFGGLGLAAVFTLFLTPALYVLIAGTVKPRNEEADLIARQLEDAGVISDGPTG